MSRILAIDYGGKRTGIAVTDPLGMIANPLETVPTKGLLAYLKEYTFREDVERFVVGEPRRLDGRPTHASQAVADFILVLQKSFPSIPVSKVDERFTSKMASATLLAAGAKKSDRQDKNLVDKVSAALILQSYLEASM